jgi:hypothetical protein
MANIGDIIGLSKLGKVLSDAVSSVFADIWCVAIFVLIDVAVPMVTPIISGTGLLTGVGGQIFANMIHVLKLQVFSEWKGTFKFGH